MKGRYYPHPHDQGQSTVSPIRGEVDLRNFINYYLKKRDSETTEWRRFMDDRNYMLILVGLNSALRFSDLSRLTADKVDGGHLYQRDMKTGKETDFDFNPKVWAELREYIRRNHLGFGDFLFPSRIGYNRPLSRKQGYVIVKRAADAVGIKSKVGTHTLRKTYGYWFYKETGDVVALQMILNHANPSVTLIYIGMQKKQVEEKRRKFVLI